MVLKRTLNISAPGSKAHPFFLSFIVLHALLIEENGAISGSIDSGTARTGVETRHFQAFATLSSPRYFAGKRPSMEQSVAPHEKLARYMPKHANSRGGQRHSKTIVRITVFGDRITLLT